MGVKEFIYEANELVFKYEKSAEWASDHLLRSILLSVSGALLRGEILFVLNERIEDGIKEDK